MAEETLTLDAMVTPPESPLHIGDLRPLVQQIAAPGVIDRVGQELRLKLQAQRPSSHTMRQWMYVAYGQRVAREEVPTFSCGGLLLRGVHPPQPSAALYLLAAWA